ncbi:hypothetical protein SeLEV6574_g05217 [Synchytrium endobioticum]|uniref:GID complex catalytic subunit 2 n=1 Tax=Synchytrium endobioticum TaxID=286115 RepID=A0A507CVC5_9FUNG|nr:hypothetical protein SeLEV6574_g05217 [Synchytrium endobioticum]
MEAAAKEFEKVIKRQKTTADTTLEGIESLIQAVAMAQARISQEPASTSTTLSTQLHPTFKSTSHAIMEAHKDLHAATSKYTKMLDKKAKQAVADLDQVWDHPDAFADKDAALGRALHAHFVREGRFALAGVFADEAGVMAGEGVSGQFAEMHTIRQDLREGRLARAIAWAQLHRAALARLGATLEFQLHRLQFVQHLTDGGVQRALGYARSVFGPFAALHMKDIQRMLGSVLFAARLARSPYAELASASMWEDAHSAFTRSFCALLGLSAEPPLYVSVTVGASALPSIAKMTAILKDRAGIEWSTAGELPVEVPLLDTQRFHSVFACPVSKEQATEDNPPMMMACGHVVNKDSLNRLSRGNQATKFKCPYCPSESTALQAQRVYF